MIYISHNRTKGGNKLIVKQRTKPRKLLQYEALLRRLPPTHPIIPKLTTLTKNLKAGYRGECEVDYQLTILSENDYLMLQDIRLEYAPDQFIQMDTIILTARFIALLEIKNFIGTLQFDRKTKQFKRIYLENEESFLDPITQVEKQRTLLKNWLEKKYYPELPILPFVIISFPYTNFSDPFSSKYDQTKILPAAALPNYFLQLEQTKSQIKIDQKEIRKLGRGLAKQHKAPQEDVLKFFALTKNDLLVGGYCQKCTSCSVIRKNGKWICMQCLTEVKDAHFQTLNDYHLLIGEKITMSEFQHFMNLHSNSIASKSLRSFQFPFTGGRKNRAYKITLDLM